MYVSSKQACQYFNVSHSTLHRWHDAGTIPVQVLPSGHRRYQLPDQASTLNRAVINTPANPQQAQIVYCRVSSPKQKADLDRQVHLLSDQYPQHRVIKDIGSGLNFKRPGLLSLLGLAMQGGVSEVVVTSKDRLCRFAFDLISWILETHGARIVVLDQTDKSPIDEIGEDVLAIMQVFACRWNGKRRYRKTKGGQKDQSLPDTASEAAVSTDGGDE